MSDSKNYVLYSVGNIYAVNQEPFLSNNEASLAGNWEDQATDNRLLGGSLVRYKIKKISHWLFQYRELPGRTKDVFDGGMGRDDIFALYQADTEMYLITPSLGATPVTYTVRFGLQSYREKPVRRSGNYWWWQLSFELVQSQ